MVDVKPGDFRGGLDGAYIKGLRLTDLNISRFNLYKMPRKSNEEETIYKLGKHRRGVYIVHNLKSKTVDWCERLD